MKFIDITGQRFGRLVAIERTEKKGSSGHLYWRCKCDCGNECLVTSSNLRNGSTKSCGCLNIEKIIERNKIKKLNKYNLSNEYGIGYDCNNSEFYFDLEDYDKIKNYTWRVNENGYVETTVDNKFIKLHRLLMNSPNNLHIDHINGDRSDNRKNNLRIATRSENNKNRKLNKNSTTGIKGVCLLPSGKYSARIQNNRNRIYIGTFDTIKQASDAYDKKAVELFGEFARLNNYSEN